jgi:hypothetical protein
MRTASITQKIREASQTMPEGAVLSARVLLHLGSRAAVDQALSRLARGGELLRVGRGLYSPPLRSRFGERGPRPEKLVRGVAALTGETIAPSGASTANALGLTTQVPVRPLFLTSGPSRRLRLGSQMVELRHAPTWQLYSPTGAAGHALRALAWLGPEHASAAVATLRSTLPAGELRALASVRGRVPSWMAEILGKELAEEAPVRV